MLWETTIWMSAALVVATSGLHLTIEHDLLAEQSSTSSFGLQQSTRRDAVHTVSGDEDLVDSVEIESEASDEKALQSIPNGQKASLSKSEEKKSSSYEQIASTNSNNNNDGNDDAGGNSNGNDSNGSENDDTGDNDNGNDSNGSENDNTGGNGNGDDGNDSENDDTGGNGNGNDSTGSGNDGAGGNSGENDGTGSDNDSTGGNDNSNIIDTTTGRVRGHPWRENKKIISYIDIKYGSITTPFEAPVLPDRLETIHDEKEHSKRCPQLQGDQYVGDIDCLTLSIFKPSDAVSASVLVYIHEGNFINGSGNPAIYGPEYLVSKGIILVLPNYRLGPLGFLCLQNETAPGNAALKDLALALSWIKANIAKFGGDHENIAVSGDGTAGALAGYLALSPMSKNNIRKVITESGSVLAYWALDRDPIDSAMDLVSRINGFQSWQTVNTAQIMTAAKDIVLRPCLERNTDNISHFMEFTPSTMIRNQEIKIAFMIGSAQYAGVHEFLNNTSENVQLFNADAGFLLPNDLYFKTSEERTRAGNRVRAAYFGNAAIGVCDVNSLTLYYTDAAYLGPGIRTARPLVDSGATVYLYEFSFVGSLNRELEAIHRPVKGAVRGDIIGYLFTQDGNVPDEGTDESSMVDILTDLWTTFLKNGTPSAENIEWKKLEKDDKPSEEPWLSIEPEPSLKTGVHVERLNIWTDIYNSHFIETSQAFGTSASVYTVLVLQLVFFISFFRNAWHFF